MEHFGCRFCATCCNSLGRILRIPRSTNLSIMENTLFLSSSFKLHISIIWEVLRCHLQIGTKRRLGQLLIEITDLLTCSFAHFVAISTLIDVCCCCLFVQWIEKKKMYLSDPCSCLHKQKTYFCNFELREAGHSSPWYHGSFRPVKPETCIPVLFFFYLIWIWKHSNNTSIYRILILNSWSPCSH